MAEAALLIVVAVLSLGCGFALDHYLRQGWPRSWYAEGRWPWERP